MKSLIGSPVVGASVLRDIKPASPRYDRQNPQSNRRLTTFEQNIQRLRDWKAKDFDHLNVSLSGWLKLGYDRQTPDALPPSEAAGGWAGMKAFFDACKELGYTCWLHDQYRDYYLDGPQTGLKALDVAERPQGVGRPRVRDPVHVRANFTGEAEALKEFNKRVLCSCVDGC